MAIVGGMIAFVLLTLFDVGLDGKRRTKKDEADSDAAKESEDAEAGPREAKGSESE